MSDFDFDHGIPRPFDQQPSKPPELGRVNLQNPIAVDVVTLAAERFIHGRYLQTADGKSEYILDENGRTILLFEGDRQHTFRSIYSPLTKEQLRREMLVLPEEQQEALSKMLVLPELTRADIEEFKRIQTSREEDKKILSAALDLPSMIHTREQRKVPDQEQIRGILQKEYGITSSVSNVPMLGTFGLGPCIALTVYDPEAQMVALGHVDATTDVNSLDRIIGEFGLSKQDLHRLQIGLIGGDDSSRKQAIQLIRFLKDRGLDLSFAEILDKSHPSAFVIDARDGQITPNITPHNNGGDEDLRMKIAGLQMNAQIKREFDGRFNKH